jgi:type II secretory pathway component PulF
MPNFAYQVSGGAGGVIVAADRASAVRQLLASGVAPADVREVASPSRGGGAAAALGLRAVGLRGQGGGGMGLAELAGFMQELSTALVAGLPLMQALRTLAKQRKKPKQRELLAHLMHEVEHGKPLSDAMQSWGDPFGELVVNLTRAGEASGQLGEVMGHTATLLEKDLRLRRSLIAATAYPGILAVMAVIAVIIVVTWIVPGIMAQLKGSTVELPWPAAVLDGFAQLVRGYWWLMLGVVVAIVISAVRFYRSPAGRLSVDRWLLDMPVVGRLSRDVAVARFTRTLSTLTTAGIPVVSALRVTKGTLGNKVMEGVIDEVVGQVSSGKTIAQPMEDSGRFPPMLVQIVNLGERSGKMDELLGRAATAFEDRTEQAVKLFTAILPPVLVVIVAIVIGFIVLAILSALMAAQDAAAMTG